MNRSVNAATAALGTMLASCALPSLTGCDQRASSATTAIDNGPPAVAYDGRALHVGICRDGSGQEWAFPLDLVGQYDLNIYPSGESVVVDLVKFGVTTPEYRFSLSYGEAPAGGTFWAFDTAQNRELFVTPADGSPTLRSAELVVQAGRTLSSPKELLALAGAANEHRFQDLSGKKKYLMVIPR